MALQDIPVGFVSARFDPLCHCLQQQALRFSMLGVQRKQHHSRLQETLESTPMSRFIVQEALFGSACIHIAA
jgi:hypothetical protein